MSAPLPFIQSGFPGMGSASTTTVAPTLPQAMAAQVPQAAAPATPTPALATALPMPPMPAATQQPADATAQVGDPDPWLDKSGASLLDAYRAAGWAGDHGTLAYLEARYGKNAPVRHSDPMAHPGDLEYTDDDGSRKLFHGNPTAAGALLNAVPGLLPKAIGAAAMTVGGKAIPEAAGVAAAGLVAPFAAETGPVAPTIIAGTKFAVGAATRAALAGVKGAAAEQGMRKLIGWTSGWPDTRSAAEQLKETGKMTLDYAKVQLLMEGVDKIPLAMRTVLGGGASATGDVARMVGNKALAAKADALGVRALDVDTPLLDAVNNKMSDWLRSTPGADELRSRQGAIATMQQGDQAAFQRQAQSLVQVLSDGQSARPGAVNAAIGQAAARNLDDLKQEVSYLSANLHDKGLAQPDLTNLDVLKDLRNKLAGPPIVDRVTGQIVRQYANQTAPEVAPALNVIQGIIDDFDANGGRISLDRLQQTREQIGQMLKWDPATGLPRPKGWVPSQNLRDVYFAARKTLEDGYSGASPGALNAFEQYNQRVSEIFEKDNPVGSAAWAKLSKKGIMPNVLKWGLQDVKAQGRNLEAVLSSLAPSERGLVDANYVESLGRDPATGLWDGSQFMHNWNMSEEVRHAFMKSPAAQQAESQVNQLIDLAGKITKAAGNTEIPSRAMAISSLVGVGAAARQLGVPVESAELGLIGMRQLMNAPRYTAKAAAYLINDPLFLRHALAFANGSNGALVRIAMLSKTNPEGRPHYEEFLKNVQSLGYQIPNLETAKLRSAAGPVGQQMEPDSH